MAKSSSKGPVVAIDVIIEKKGLETKRVRVYAADLTHAPGMSRVIFDAAVHAVCDATANIAPAEAHEA